MAKAKVNPFNGLMPINKFVVPITNPVPPRPAQHAVLMNPLGLRPSKSRVIAGTTHAMLPAESNPKTNG
jgi:hypothetical protein